MLKLKRNNPRANLKNQTPGSRNLMRILRRRLGLTQRELAYVIGYESDTQVSHIENGSRTPHLAEVLMIELLFGIPAITIFPQIRSNVGARMGHRVRQIMVDLSESDCAHARVSYKNAQLQRVLASLKSRDELDQSESFSWHTER